MHLDKPNLQKDPPSQVNNLPRWRLFLSWASTRQFVGLLTILGITLLLIGTVNFWHLMNTDDSNGLYLANSLLSFIGILILAYAIHVARRDLLSPLAELSNWATRIRQGQFDTRLPEATQPEFRKLYRDINNLGDRFEELSLDMQSQVEKQTDRIKLKSNSLEILYDIAASINAASDLEDLLTRFLHTLKEVVGARAGSVRMLTSDNRMQLIASSGLSSHIVEQEKLVDINRCLCGKAALDGEVHALNDLKSCGEFAGQSFFGDDQIEMIAVPLRYRGKTLGVYNLFTEQSGLVEREDMKSLLTSIGHHLGMAIEKSRLDEETNLLSIMEERTRMANELHDSLAQSLASLRFQVRVLDETLHSGNESELWHVLERIENSLDEAYTELRELIAHFRAPIDKRGLIPAVQQAVERFRRDSQISAFLQLEWESKPLPAEIEIQVLRIIQEALANIRKHSQANAVRVIMRALAKDDFLVLVEDDGVGIKEPATSAPGEHLGLKILKERTARIGGTLRIESEAGEGTRIILKFHRPAEVTDSLRHSVTVDTPKIVVTK
jgi:two-component system nitrate/nitrite sensor histidine kinase NarX